jgi:uncharacterized protein (TIGR02271 family)
MSASHDSPSSDDQLRPGPTQAVETTLHEERAVAGTELRDAGRVRVQKHVETVTAEQVVPRNIEHAETERAPAAQDDTGEVITLPDGSVSIPIFEEVLVVTKKLVVRERIVVRKETVIDEYTLRTELRREHASVEADDEVDLDDRRQ